MYKKTNYFVIFALITFHSYCATQKYALRKITEHSLQCQNQGVGMFHT